jgi:hypothetical protein
MYKNIVQDYLEEDGVRCPDSEVLVMPVQVFTDLRLSLRVGWEPVVRKSVLLYEILHDRGTACGRYSLMVQRSM